MQKVCVLGLGYIGLPTSLVIADSGIEVIGVDINKKVIDSINLGKVHIKEPGLDNLLKKVIGKNFKAAQYPSNADVFIIAVPTPFKTNNSEIPEPEIKFVLEAAEAISKVIKKGDLVILESTSPIGTTEEVHNLIFTKSNLGINDFFVAHCPERVLPGKILVELIQNDRVIGGTSKVAAEKAKIFYEIFCKGEIHTTSSKLAELVKLSENAYRDVNVAFANELSLVCDKENIDIRELVKLANNHPRVNILQPSCGVGGHCIAVDPWFIVSGFPEITKLIKTARLVNDAKSTWSINKIIKEIEKIENDLGRQPILGILGITFKPNVDDLRESPALFIASKVSKMINEVYVCEPNLVDHPFINLKDLNFVLDKSDLVVILVAHDEFKKLVINQPKIDLCGALSEF